MTKRFDLVSFVRHTLENIDRGIIGPETLRGSLDAKGWAGQCDGLTKEEIAELGYVTSGEWFVDDEEV